MLGTKEKPGRQMRTGVIIQARMDSTRLPGKALVNLAGRTLLERIYRRMLLCKKLDNIVIATSYERRDQAIVDLCRTIGAPVFTGPEDDVLTRLLGVCEDYQFDAIVRVTGDNPLTDPEGIDQLIVAFRQTPCDLLHSVHRRGFPYGTGAELIPRTVLETCNAELGKEEWRERITSYILECGHFDCRCLDAPTELQNSDCFLSVDYPEDVELISQIYSHFQGRDDIPLIDILFFLRANPHLIEINAHRHSPLSD